MQFTKDQQRVIDARNKNILVSAAAGSGKTAVLVERIIQMVIDEKEPLDIDRLLIVTFTNAAAAEMRERIFSAINEELLKRPELDYEKLALIHTTREELPYEVWEEAEIKIKYDGYIKRQQDQVNQAGKLEKFKIPENNRKKACTFRKKVVTLYL